MISIIGKTYKELIIYFLLFLIGFNFSGNAVLWVYLLAIFTFFFLNKTLIVPKSLFSIVILFVGIIYSQLLYNVNITLFSLMKLGVYPVIFVTFFKIASYEMKTNEECNNCIDVFFYIMYSFVLGNMAHMFADIINTDLTKLNLGRRILNDIWSGGTAPTTIIVGWGCLNMAIFLYAFEKRKTKKMVFLCSAIMLAVYMYFSLVVATRLGIVNALLTLALFVILLIVDKNTNFSINTVIKFAASVAVGSFVVVKMFPYITSSNLYIRLTNDSLGLLDSNGRLAATIYLLQHFFESFWGGEYFTRQYGLQQHNILFQMYDLYGLVPFICLGHILLESIKNLLLIVKKGFYTNSEKRFVVLVLFSLMLYCFEEPAITSNFIITSMLFGYLGYIAVLRKVAVKLVKIDG